MQVAGREGLEMEGAADLGLAQLALTWREYEPAIFWDPGNF